MDVLASLRSKFAEKPNLDFEGFVDAVRRAEPAVCSPQAADSTPIPSMSGVTANDGAWWEEFGIDWSRYHSRAREILNDPFYWDPSNDGSPHSANAGAGYLAEFRRWRTAHPVDSPWDFLVRGFKQAGIFGRFNEFRATDPANYVERDGVIGRMHDESAIALAFALLKVDGACDPMIGAIALQALTRKCDPEIAARLRWQFTSQEIAVASKLRDELSRHLRRTDAQAS